MVAPPEAKPAPVAVPKETPLPDFTVYKDIPAKKRAFIAYMKPLIAMENATIAKERDRLSKLHDTFETHTPTPEDLAWLKGLAKRYRLSPFSPEEADHRQALLHRVDIIPLALAVAQAANESAWGTSRFAREGNNMYGQWVYGAKDGMIPKNRDAGATHKVARFDSVSDSIRSYILNLNSLWAYETLRSLRKEQRQQGIEPDGETLALGIGRYSSRGEDYIREIQQLIRLNQNLISQS